MPEGVNWLAIVGASCLSGIGFTMSIFISELAFTDDADLIGEAKIGILIASVAAGAIGYFVLRKALGASSS